MAQAQAKHPPTGLCTVEGWHRECPHIGQPKERKPMPSCRKPIRQRRSRPRRHSGKCPGLVEWIRTQPCFVTGKRDGETMPRHSTDMPLQVVVVEAAHLPRVRKWGDLNNCLPLAMHLHRYQHGKGRRTFAAKVGHTLETLAELARAYTARYLAEKGLDAP